MKYFEYEISDIDGSAAKFVGYCLDNSEEIVPDRVRPSVLVIPGGGYEMTSDREAEPIAMQFLAAGFNAFVLRYSVKPSVFPVALLEAADAMKMIREHADLDATGCRMDAQNVRTIISAADAVISDPIYTSRISRLHNPHPASAQPTKSG